MRTRLLTTITSLSAAVLAASGALHAQTFKVEKFDIKGDGGTDYVTVEAGTGRVFVSRCTHMMVVDGATGKVLGDIPNTPGVHGAGLATKAGHGFTTNGGDSDGHDVRPEDAGRDQADQGRAGGLDGIMYDEPDDKIILTNHSRPIGTLTAHRSRRPATSSRRSSSRTRRPKAPRPTARAHLRQQRRQEHDSGDRREDVEGDGVVAARAVRRADRHRLRRGDRTASSPAAARPPSSSMPATGKVVATIANGTRVDALGWDPAKKLIYIPNGGEGNVTVVHQDSPDKYTVVATVPTFAGREDDRGRSDDPQRRICSSQSAVRRRRRRAGAPPPAAAAAAAVRRVRSIAGWFIVITS